MIGKGHQNLNTIETKNGVTLKVCNSKLYIKAESEESEKLAVREIKSLAVGTFYLKNSAKLIKKRSNGKVRSDNRGKIISSFYITRTVRVNGTFFPTGLHNSQLSQTAAHVRSLALVVYEATAYLITRNSLVNGTASWLVCGKSEVSASL